MPSSKLPAHPERSPRRPFDELRGGGTESKGAAALRLRPSRKERGTASAQRERRGASWSVYVLRCRDGSLYTGVTTDLERRLRMHHAGRAARYTRGRGPFVVVHVEEVGSRGDALRRELAIKRLPAEEKRRLPRAARAAARRLSAGSAAPT